MPIATKRIYQAVSKQDGTRILLDRIWPRGIKKADAQIDLWPKDLTPSTELRKWFHEDTERHWPEFQQRYRQELQQHLDAVEEIRQLAQKGSITLLTAAENEQHNHLQVFKQLLEHPGK